MIRRLLKGFCVWAAEIQKATQTQFVALDGFEPLSFGDTAMIFGHVLFLSGIHGCGPILDSRHPKLKHDLFRGAHLTIYALLDLVTKKHILGIQKVQQIKSCDLKIGASCKLDFRHAPSKMMAAAVPQSLSPAYRFIA